MEIILQTFKICFWIFVYAIAHTYVLYPIILRILSVRKKDNQQVWKKDDNELPAVSIVMAAYNEESVIEEKIHSVYSTGYPEEKIEFLIGSDNSSDKTNAIIEKYTPEYHGLKLYAFGERQGKAKIINRLSQEAENNILILTDANVYFTKGTIYQLVKHYKNPEIHLVGGLIQNTNLKRDGISYQEKTYLSGENKIKHMEGILWGSMIGAFGGVYSIRKEAYHPVPLNYYMDDFYITMHVLQDGGKAIKELNAVCKEDISNQIKEEFRRKVRISIGNFQNLSSFWKLIFPLTSGVSFSFISHKIFRWITPFFLLACLIISGVLALYSDLYAYIFAAQLGGLLVPFFDFLLKKIHIHVVFLRFITHFYSMNLALLTGFFKFIKGVDSNVWQPTKRNQ